MTSINYGRIAIAQISFDEPTYFVDGVLTTKLSRDTGEAAYNHQLRTKWVLSRSYISLQEEKDPNKVLDSLILYSRIHTNKVFGRDNIPTYSDEVEEEYKSYLKIDPYSI